MALTPSDVEQKTFSTALRGYDLDEVDDFLDEVVMTIRDLEDQVAAAKMAAPVAAEAAAAAAHHDVDESAVGRVLITAQNTADTMIADAQEEADRILAEAKVDAETWVEERDRKKAEADAEMAELATHVAGVRTQLALLATAVADRLDEMDSALGSGGNIDEEAETDEAAEVEGSEKTTSTDEDSLGDDQDEDEDTAQAEGDGKDEDEDDESAPSHSAGSAAGYSEDQEGKHQAE